jgi:hypothetical protein
MPATPPQCIVFFLFCVFPTVSVFLKTICGSIRGINDLFLKACHGVVMVVAAAVFVFFPLFLRA